MGTHRFFVLLGAAAFAACTAADVGETIKKITEDGANDTPGISIISPAEGAMVTIGADELKSFPVEISVANFEAKAAGECGEGQEGKCGHIHLYVDDGPACNPKIKDFAGAEPYNNSGAGPVIEAHLGSCPVASGKHTIKVELYNDDHTELGEEGEDDETAGEETDETEDGEEHASKEAEITVKAVYANPPTMSIVSPAEGATVTMGTDAGMSVPVSVTTENFDTAKPGTCPEESTCGHFHLFIDGTACNKDGGTGFYNNSGTSPVDAHFADCATPAGPHAITVEMHNNDHSPVADGNGKVVKAVVNVTSE